MPYHELFDERPPELRHIPDHRQRFCLMLANEIHCLHHILNCVNGWAGKGSGRQCCPDKRGCARKMGPCLPDLNNMLKHQATIWQRAHLDVWRQEKAHNESRLCYCDNVEEPGCRPLCALDLWSPFEVGVCIQKKAEGEPSPLCSALLWPE